jgi:hypothetical protein
MAHWTICRANNGSGQGLHQMSDPREASGLHDWLVPPEWSRLISDIKYRIANRAYLQSLRQNREFLKLHSDCRRCFVIGNGPSLKTQDLRPLAKEMVIVANSFFQHPDHRLIAPRYYCVGDPEFVAGHANSIAWLRELEAALPETTLFCPPEAKSIFAKNGLFKHHRVRHMDHVRVARRPEQVRIDLTQPLNVGFSTGTAFSIPLALYLGFPEIYLIGFDANWLEDMHKGAIHFYETNKYFPHFDHTASEGHEMEGQLSAMGLEFGSHRLLRERAKLMGSRIMNATNGGWLDMYPRVRYESLF